MLLSLSMLKFATLVKRFLDRKNLAVMLNAKCLSELWRGEYHIAT
jgi:hypothetical protein